MPFPRGPQKIRKTFKKKKKEGFLFNDITPFVGTKRKREEKTEEAPQKRRKKEKTYAHQVNWKSLKSGDAVLGVVKEINELDVKVSLPNMKTGYCHIREISSTLGTLIDEFAENEGQLSDLPSLSSLIEVGQMLTFVVLATEKTKKNFQRIELTMREDLVNHHLNFEDPVEGQLLQCCVESIEDRGYVISSGIEGVRGFCKAKSKNRFVLGQAISLQISTIQREQKVLIFSLPSADVVERCPKFTMIRPGQKVQVKCKKFLTNGLLCSLLGSKLTGTVHATHVGQDNEIEEGQKLFARILFCSYDTKALAFTFLPHLVDGGKGFSFDSETRAGSKHTAKCYHVGINELLLKLDSGNDARCHASQLSDEVVEHLKESEFLDKEFDCRVLSTNLLDGLVNVTMKASILNRELMFFTDAKVGMKVSGQIVKCQENYMLLQLTPGIRGTISQTLAGRTKLQDIQNKYTEGQRLEVVILASIPPNKLELSDKPDLLKLDFNRIEDYNAAPNTISKGVIIGVTSRGIKLLFFSKTFGWVSKEELQACGYTEKIDQMFQQGQVVECRVLGSDPNFKQMVCTLNLEVGEIISDRPKEGSVVKVKIAGIGKKAVQVYMKKGGMRLKGIIPFHLLSDHSKNTALLKTALQRKQSLKAVVLQIMPNYMVLTLKATLKTAIEKQAMPRKFERINNGFEAVGYVVCVDKIGVFVRFLCALTGLAPRTECIHLFGKEPEDLFEVGQTVRAKIFRINRETQRFQITLRSSKFQKKCAWLKQIWTSSYFDEIKFLASLKDFTTDWGEFAPGARKKTTVTAKQPFGFLTKFPDISNGPLGLALSGFHTKESIGEQDTHETTVLDFSPHKNIVDVSFRDELSGYQPVKEIPTKKKFEATIEFLKDDYMCLSIESLNCLAFATVTAPNVCLQPREVFNVGQTVKCKLLELHGSGRLLVSVNLNMVQEMHQIESAGTRKWEFFDSDVKCFTDFQLEASL